MLFTILISILIASFLIFIHELGHYLLARKVGIHVEEFSIGFPPKIFSKEINGTNYVLSWIPLGGYVKLEGQNIEDEDLNSPTNYASKGISQRFSVLIAGPVMNLLVALIFMPLVYLNGIPVPADIYNPPIIGNIIPGSQAEITGFKYNDRILSINSKSVKNWKEVQDQLNNLTGDLTSVGLIRENQVIDKSFETSKLRSKGGFGWSIKAEAIVGGVNSGSPAEKAGIIAGDKLIKFNQKPIRDWGDISGGIQKNQGAEGSLIIVRSGRELEIKITPEKDKRRNYWYIGISRSVINVSYSFTESVKLGTLRVYSLAKSTYSFIGTLFSGKAKKDEVGGPVMIAKMLGKAARKGISELLGLVSFISLQLAIFNLLPIPALDGGHIFFLIIEKIKGKNLSPKLRERIQATGFSILLLLILFVTFQDLLNVAN